MKILCLVPLLFLSACSSAPKLALRPAQSPPLADDSGVRLPEVLRAYHVGRYADPNDDWLMHEQHTVYRVEAGARWDLRPGPVATSFASPADAAFRPAPVNDAVLAEVNAQRTATMEILSQSRTLAASLAQVQAALAQAKSNFQETARLRATVADLQKRLDALATTTDTPVSTTTNEPPDSLSP